MAYRGKSNALSAIGPEQTSALALHMSVSAYDPKRTRPGRPPRRKGRSLRMDCDGKPFDCPKARSLSPTNRTRWHSQLQLWPAFEESLQRTLALNAGELVAQAEMDPRPKRQVAVGSPLEIEFLRVRVGIRIHVGGSQHDHDFVALLQPNPAEPNI